MNAEVENKDVELGVLHSQLEDKSHVTSELENKMRALEEKLESAPAEKESFGEQSEGCTDGLRTGSGLGFDRGYRPGYTAFPSSRDMKNLIEAYRQRLFQQIWHSMIFLKEDSSLAHAYFGGAVKICQEIVNKVVHEAGITFNWGPMSRAMKGHVPGW